MQCCSSFGLILTLACFVVAQDSSQRAPFLLAPAEDTAPQWVRDARNKAFNVRSGRPSMIEPDESGVLPITILDFAPTPEFPYAGCDLVVVGTITRLQPFLSADKKNIYTEYTLQVVEPVKNTAGISVLPGDSLALVTEGGAARLSDGRVVQRILRNHIEPTRGQQYLLFLRYRPKLEAVSYIKMWLVQNGAMKPVYPDDVVRERENKSEYSGKPLREVVMFLRGLSAKRGSQ